MDTQAIDKIVTTAIASSTHVLYYAIGRRQNIISSEDVCAVAKRRVKPTFANALVIPYYATREVPD